MLRVVRETRTHYQANDHKGVVDHTNKEAQRHTPTPLLVITMAIVVITRIAEIIHERRPGRASFAHLSARRRGQAVVRAARVGLRDAV